VAKVWKRESWKEVNGGGHGLDTGLIAIEEQELCDYVLIIAHLCVHR